MEPIVKAIFDGVVDGQHTVVVAAVNAALEARVTPERVLNEALTPA